MTGGSLGLYERYIQKLDPPLGLLIGQRIRETET